MTGSGALVVISAPSGGGKTTIINGVLARNNPRLVYSVSATTRAPRKNERDGESYIFLSLEEFQQRIDAGDFVEWAEVHGNLYGTLKSTLEASIEKGEIVLLDIDVQGGLNVKKFFGKRAFLIFIKPPGEAELRKRLRNRKTENAEVIARRLAAMPGEIAQSKHYDKIVVNDQLEKTIEQVYTLINTKIDFTE